MALSTVARSYSVRIPTALRRQTLATWGTKRAAKVAASAQSKQPEGQTSRRDVAKSVLLAAPLVAGLFPSTAPAQDFPVVPPGCIPGVPPAKAVLGGVGQDAFAGYAIFKYLVPAAKERDFVAAFIAAQKAALPGPNNPNPVKGIKDFTIFRENADPKPDPITYFSVALFDTTQDGVNFICTQAGKDFVKGIIALGVQFLPAGATYQDKLFLKFFPSDPKIPTFPFPTPSPLGGP